MTNSLIKSKSNGHLKMRFLDEIFQNNDVITFQNLFMSELQDADICNIACFCCDNDNPDLHNIFLDALKKMHPDVIPRGLNPCLSKVNHKLLQCIIDHEFDHDQYSKLFLRACLYLDIKSLELLLNCGVDINYENSSAFFNVCMSGNVHVCKFLLDNGLTIDYNNPNIINGFKVVIINRDLDLTEFLSNYGFDFSFFNNLNELKDTRDQKFIDILMTHGVEIINIIGLLVLY
ncbi:putative ankyrin repeat protein [Cotonvirus japonicus]|uniref:Ankyrin repeat protein n=1 Tax=Cotonvirus japonicus TaxID=2811091 RepID=A0ABM7NQX8_9VIRU|nr:putative ankyrin repeat protein [Cotonvirus japonicus]BCS82506.1 putative ankyrin repeat protein [Cotonvirus japonicus]